MDLTLLERILEDDMPDITGYADASITLSGSIDAPSFEGQIDVPALKIKNWGPIEFWSKFRYEYGVLLAQLGFADEQGSLFDSEGSLLVDLVNLVQHPSETIETLETSPWRFSMRVPPRRLSDLPDVFGRRIVPDPHRLQLAASLTLAGGAFRTRGDFHASFDWRSDSSEGLCGSEANPRATLRAEFENDVTEITMDGVVGSSQVFRLDATAETPLDDWLKAAEMPDLPVTRLSADFYNAPTENIPYVCRYAAGLVKARLRVADLFGDDPTMSFTMNTDQLRARRLEPGRRGTLVTTIVETPPTEGEIRAQYHEGVGTLDATMDWWNGGFTTIAVEVPLVWNRDQIVPALRRARQATRPGQFRSHATTGGARVDGRCRQRAGDPSG